MADRHAHCPIHGPTCANWSAALQNHVTALTPDDWGPERGPDGLPITSNDWRPSGTSLTPPESIELLDADERKGAEAVGGCISLALWLALAMVAAGLVTYGVIQLREIKNELRRANAISCSTQPPTLGGPCA